jgi:hypothetical protein
MRYSGTATRQIPTGHGRMSPGSVFSICAFISTADAHSTADAQPGACVAAFACCARMGSASRGIIPSSTAPSGAAR